MRLREPEGTLRTIWIQKGVGLLDRYLQNPTSQRRQRRQCERLHSVTVPKPASNPQRLQREYRRRERGRRARRKRRCAHAQSRYQLEGRLDRPRPRYTQRCAHGHHRRDPTASQTPRRNQER